MRRLFGAGLAAAVAAASLTSLGMATPALAVTFSLQVKVVSSEWVPTHRQPQGDSQSGLRSPSDKRILGSQGQAAGLSQGSAEDFVHG